jgi:hypothetical protein
MEQVTRQFGTHNPWFRVVRALLAGLGVIVALGHVPGFDGQPIGVAAFEYVGVAVAVLSGLITSEKPT